MSVQKFLIIQTAFLGDAILTLPMIQVLSKKNPNSQIDVVSIPSTKEIFEASPYVNKVLVLDKRGKHKSLINLYNFVSLIKNENYTRIYSPHRSFRTSLIVLLSRVKETYGFDTSALSFVYKKKIKYESYLHEVERNLKLIGLINERDNWKIKPVINIHDSIVKKIDELLNKITGRRIIAIAPGSVWNTKKYPTAYFEKVVDYLIAKNFYVVLIGGSDDKILCRSISQKYTNSIQSFAGNLNIIESIELIKRCSLILCNDSAPTHLGMIADIPTLTIYCSTIPQFGFYPYNKKSDYLSFNELNCKPCGIHGHDKCPINTFDCGYKLMPEMVIEKIAKLLD